MKGERIGTISIRYNCHYTGMMEDLSDIQYEFNNYIKYHKKSETEIYDSKES